MWNAGTKRWQAAGNMQTLKGRFVFDNQAISYYRNYPPGDHVELRQAIDLSRFIFAMTASKSLKIQSHMRFVLLTICGFLFSSLALAQRDDDYQDNTAQIGKAIPGRGYSGTCKIIVPPNRILKLAFNDDNANAGFPYRVSISKSLKADGSDADKRASFNGPCDEKDEFNKTSPYEIPNRLGTPIVVVLEFEDADKACEAKSRIWGAQHVYVTVNNEGQDYTIEGVSVRHVASIEPSKLIVKASISNPMNRP